MSRLVNPATGTVVHVEGDLEKRYRARGWAEPNAQPKEPQAAPDKPAVNADDDKPATRSNAKRNK